MYINTELLPQFKNSLKAIDVYLSGSGTMTYPSGFWGRLRLFILSIQYTSTQQFIFDLFCLGA